MSEIVVYLPFAVILLVIGAGAGVLAGLLGVGGGIVLVPAYFYAFSALGFGGDQLMQVCVATSLATIIVTSLRSVQSHNRKGAVDWKILRAWAPGIAIGAVLGLLVASRVSSGVLQGVFGAAGLAVGLYMALGRSNWQLATSLPGGAGRAGVSSGLGFLSVLMGIGGGTFGVPIMTLCAVPIHRAVATAAGFGLIIALPSAIGFLFLNLPEGAAPPLTIGAVNLPAFALTIAMTLVTTPLGAKLAHAMDPGPLKRVFGGFLILVALNMLGSLVWG